MKLTGTSETIQVLLPQGFTQANEGGTLLPLTKLCILYRYILNEALEEDSSNI